MDGTWKSQQSWDGMAEGAVTIAPYANMPDDVAKMAAETSRPPLRPARFIPFTGPITKQDGTVVGEAGKPLPDGDILGMNWYVKGVDDQVAAINDVRCRVSSHGSRHFLTSDIRRLEP